MTNADREQQTAEQLDASVRQLDRLLAILSVGTLAYIVLNFAPLTFLTETLCP